MVPLLLLITIFLTGCSSDSWRMKPPSQDAERKHIIEQGQDFCERYPDDVACPSKGRR
jgi:hypothetical protein